MYTLALLFVYDYWRQLFPVQCSVDVDEPRWWTQRYIWGPIREAHTLATSHTSWSRRDVDQGSPEVTARVCPSRERGALREAGGPSRVAGCRGRTRPLPCRQRMTGSRIRTDEASVQAAPSRHTGWSHIGRHWSIVLRGMREAQEGWSCWPSQTGGPAEHESVWEWENKYIHLE